MLKKIFISIGIAVVAIYVLFLAAPLFLTKLANSYSDELINTVKDTTGFVVKLENIKFVTTPKLTAGIKIGHIDVSFPTGDKFLESDNLQAKLSLLHLLTKKIKIDMVGADNINLTLKIKKDGKFLIEDYMPKDETISDKSDIDNVPTVAKNPLPFGIKLSNHLPNIKIYKYNISLVDIQTLKSYSINGNKLSITDFVLDKKIKIEADGKIQLQDREQFAYDVKIFNKIMPNLDLNDLVFYPQPQTESAQNNININPLDILKALYTNQLTANIKTDIKTSGTVNNINLNGNINISDISIAVDGKPLPKSYTDIIFKENKIKLDTKLYSAINETTEIFGDFKTGKHPKIDLTCKSNAKINSIINIADSVLKTFGINDLNSLSATGAIDADFNIKSDLKKIISNGYIKIPSASILYKLYNISVDKIFADIKLNNNLIVINDSGFSIMGHPLKIKGKISNDAVADICIKADKLQIKGLLLTAAQFALLKENNIKSGTVSLDVDLIGRLDKILPKVYLSVDDVNLKNIPSDTNITLAKAEANLKPEGGNIDISNTRIINPMADITLPLAKIIFDEKNINIEKSYILLNNSKIDISGIVTDYVTKNIKFNVNASGRLLSSDLIKFIPKEYISEVKSKGALPISLKITGNDKTQKISFNLKSDVQNYLALLAIDELNGKETTISGDLQLNGNTLKFSDNTGIYSNSSELAHLKGDITDLYKSQKLNLNLSTINNINTVIPYFAKSKMNAGGNISITGTALNPILKGNINIPTLSMPELDLTMKDMAITLNGPIAKGNGTLGEFKFGGIKAEKLSSDFELKNDVFYLNNLNGDSFNGKIKGDISYNIVNTQTVANIVGLGMDAVKAIEGAIGIKNALSGTLNFTADVKTSGATDVEMMKNLKGKADFDVKNGQLLNIGRFENFLLAKNLLAIPAVKTTIDSVSSLNAIKNTSIFKTLDGSITFSDGWANLNPVKMSGNALSYYITGKYNLTNGSANVIILGRLSAEVVKLLGPIGEMSLTKITTALFGERTANIVKILTTNPDKEKTENIPALSSGNTNFKDFKVEFNGGVESTSSVKSFKWLSECDTSEINIKTLKEAIEDTKKTIEETKKESQEKFNKAIEEHKQNVQDAKKQLEETTQKIKEEQQKQAAENKKQLEETKKQLEESKKELQQSAQDIKDAANELKNLFKFGE